MAAEMAALRLPEFHSATALHAPAPPQWRRPAGEAPRPFLVKGAGQLSCSPRMFQKVSRRLNSNGHAQINAATYSSREFCLLTRTALPTLLAMDAIQLQARAVQDQPQSLENGSAVGGRHRGRDQIQGSSKRMHQLQLRSGDQRPQIV
eukprot:COSAG02_NODE_9190_length_2296_cov_1.956759_2_plen_148_part_00